MKKFLLSLIALPLLAVGFTSCDDDDNDLPQVKMQVAVSGGVQNADDNKIYVEQGTPLVFDSIEAVSTNGKKTTVGLTTYFLEGIPVAQTVTVPFSASFDTSSWAPGEYSMQIKSEVYQVDKSPAFVVMYYTVEVTPSTGDDTGSDSGSTPVVPDNQTIAEQ